MMSRQWRRAAHAVIPLMAGVLAACGGDDDNSSQPGAIPLTVPKVASCSSGDVPESALQGQVPAALRASGFKGFNCNLTKLGQYQGEGGNWSHATFTDGARRTCGYHSTGAPVGSNGASTGRLQPGVPVIDITDPSKPVRTTSLTTTSMLDPWESLRVNARRQILVADNGANGAGGPEIDIYDLSGDCRSPQLMASTAIGTGTDGSGVVTPTKSLGHEGNITTDGLTYYIGDPGDTRYMAVDLSNTSRPKAIAYFDISSIGLVRAHGLSISADGNRMYAVSNGRPTATEVGDPNAPLRNGFIVFDTSEVQARVPNAKIKHISTTLYKDGSVAQHTIPVKIGGKPYMVMVDEGGSGGLADAQNQYIQTACAAGLAPFPMARLYDLSDEVHPQIVSKMMLETHDCKNQAAVAPDVVGLATFTYGSHYCSVDNRENATALACSYFNSGIRVFDIRDPQRPKEIAYYNPASATSVPGSNHVMFGQWRAGGPDWCAARLDFDFAKKQLVTMCQDNGLLVLQFAPSTWPFTTSTASRDQT
jgi:hypothetical protein